MHNTYKVIYTQEAKDSLDSFFKYMADHCIYRDSWLYGEEFMIQNYIDSNRQFIDDLKEKIEETVHKWIFWQIEKKTDVYEITRLVIFLRSYNITLECVRWLKEDVFVVENLIIRT
jgi:hypothetical protein